MFPVKPVQHHTLSIYALITNNNFWLIFSPDTGELESQLKEAKDAGIKVIVSDGVFSMDGSIAPLKLVGC